MANISTLLARILTARYGRDMRQDLHDAIEAVNDDTETALGKSLAFTTNTRKLKLLAKDNTLLSEVVIPGGGSGGGSVDSVNGLFPDENGNVELNLGDINDVDITSAEDGDALIYDSTSGKWINGAGGGGTSDYTQLTNKPSINGVTLSGNKASSDLGLSGSEELSAILNVYGSKNLNVYPYQETTNTISGITFRDNGDGSITANGMTTSNYAVFSMRLVGVSPFKLKKGTYKLSGCPNKSGLSIVFQFDVNGETVSVTDLGNGATFTLNDDAITKWCYLYVDSNIDLTQAVTFYPMLRDARITDNTFVPYALTNSELSKKTSGLSNRNLLDNPWFTVNQKGFTSGSIATIGESVPFIDRWKGNYQVSATSSISLSNNQLTLTVPSGVGCGFSQGSEILQSMASGKATVSIMFADNTILSKEITLSATPTVYDIGTYNSLNVDYRHYVSLNAFTFVFTNNGDSQKTATVKAVKFELGTESTLALDTAPDYASELLKCQRYYVPLPRYWNGLTAGINGTYHLVNISLPTKMRTTPTLSGSAYIEGALSGSTVSETIATSSMTVRNADSQFIQIEVQGSNQFDKNGNVIFIPSSGAALSAEL